MTNEEILAEIREAIDLNRIAREANNDALCHAENALRNKDYMESNYEKGVEAGLASYEIEMKKAYNKGLEVAWQLVKDLRYMDYDDKIECFGLEFDGQEKWLEIIDKFIPQEAIERLQAYKREQAEIKVGDVVRVKCGYEFVVTHISEDGHLFGICGKGDVYTAIPINQCIKTGKHIDIQQMLNQIGGEESCN